MDKMRFIIHGNKSAVRVLQVHIQVKIIMDLFGSEGFSRYVIHTWCIYNTYNIPITYLSVYTFTLPKVVSRWPFRIVGLGGGGVSRLHSKFFYKGVSEIPSLGTPRTCFVSLIFVVTKVLCVARELLQLTALVGQSWLGYYLSSCSTRFYILRFKSNFLKNLLRDL